ncbi:GerAB/ArcD/ProY family transporter [Bacillus marinisedimentorum]|uniref:GerAB/ArcD/ProY family transporter n=1 Tax=Bacillus marinisedimentorum TaxID=1821260 RepID=UPI0007DE8A41|nr:endospore germination permease [Bacillus marinisedimentorum]
MQVVSYRQTAFLLSMSLPVMGHMFLIPTIVEGSGRDSWIAIVITVPFAIFFGFSLHRLHKLFPDKDYIQILEHNFGRIAGKAIGIAVIGYFLFMAFVTFYGIVNFIQTVFLVDTPWWALQITFYPLVIYTAVKGVEAIARASMILFVIIIFTGESIALTTNSLKDYNLLLPVLSEGLQPVLYGVALTAALYGEFILLLMLRLRRATVRSKSLFFINTVTVFLIAWMFLGTVTSSISIFGVDQVKNLEYPAQSIVRLVEFGFIERFDIYGILTMISGGTIRMALLHWVLGKGIGQVFGIKKKWLIHSMLFVLLFSLPYAIGSYRVFVDIILFKLYPLTAVISVGLTLLVWLVAEVKTGKNKKKMEGKKLVL